MQARAHHSILLDTVYAFLYNGAMLRSRIAWALALAFLATRLCAAPPPVIISEFMAENNGFLLDSFGNASDWLELQNTTGSPIDLQGWSLTDDAADLEKWILPAVILPPFGTRLIWASSADLRDPAKELHTNFALSKKGEFLGLCDASGTLVHSYAPTFPAQYENIAYGYALSFVTNSSAMVSNTSPVRAYCPANDALGTLWRQVAFDDSSWTSGFFPVGYGTRNPAWLPEVNFSLQGLAYGKPGVYLRSSFNLDSASAVQALAFEMTYDDGASVFINGTFACSANAPSFQTLSYTNYSSSILGDPSSLAATDISAITNVLTDGVNVLAVHLMNANASSSDLFLKLRLASIVRTMTVTNEPTFLITPTPGKINGDETTQRLPQIVIYSETQNLFTAPFTLTLSGHLTGQTIRYTTNGAEPSFTTGTLYSAPLSVSKSLHIRARVFDAAGRSSVTATAQYTFCATDPATLAFATAMPILILRETDPVFNGIPFNEWDNNSNYVACSAHFIEPVGGASCLTSAPALTARAGIHVRGSSSSGFPKKPYALTFWGEDNDDKKVDLSGFPKGSDFALISCYNFDRTYMHDALLFDLSRQIGRYAPRTRWVELFTISNETNALTAATYAGLYVIEERVKAGSGRVPIDDIVSPADVSQPNLSGSYLFKTDRNDADEFYWRTTRNFPNSTGRYMVMGYPKLADLQPEQSRYLVDAFNAFEDAIYGTDPMNPDTGAPRYIDLLSWADFHIYKMFSMDVDLLTLSTWFHKDRGGKIMAGPLWDFDRSLGPYGYNEAAFPNVKRWDAWTFSPEPFNRGDFWGKLHAQPAFQRLYWDRWFELRKGVWSETNLVATIVRLKSEIPEAAATRDYVKWNQWPTNDAFGRTHPGEVNWMTWFVTNHAAWIDQNFVAKCSLLKAPVLSPDACALSAGETQMVTLTAPEGNVIYFTLDGSDPALWNNQANSSATPCKSGMSFALTQSANLFARAYNTVNGRWSLAARAEYLIGGRHARPGDILLSEIHYNPCNPLPNESAKLPEVISRAYEFVELLNVATCDISLDGCRFPEGQPADALTLGTVILKPGEHAVVARHSEAFAQRYGTAVTPIAYWLYGGLNDAGETVTLLNRDGVTLDSVKYKTSGKWPAAADGGGFSLNRVSFSPRVTLPWTDVIPTPGKGAYPEWAGLRGLSPDDGDDDHDGVANLIEYYSGSDPLDPSDRGTADIYGFSIDANGLSLAYRQDATHQDVTATLEASEDLLEWEPVGPPHLQGTPTGPFIDWSLNLPAEEIAAHPRRFFRLRVVQPRVSYSGGTLLPPL